MKITKVINSAEKWDMHSDESYKLTFTKDEIDAIKKVYGILNKIEHLTNNVIQAEYMVSEYSTVDMDTLDDTMEFLASLPEDEEKPNLWFEDYHWRFGKSFERKRNESFLEED